MIEIVFGDSACGNLKMAQRCGEGEFNGSIGVIITHDDGSKPSPEEIAEAQREAEEKSHLAWKNAIPLGGDPADVYGFSLALSIGDISENEPGAQQQKTLERLFSVYPDDLQDAISVMLQNAKDTLAAVCERAVSGYDALRIWYSDNPDEACGLYWLMAQLEHLGTPLEQLYLVKLPDWISDSNGNIARGVGWGQIAPEGWHQYLSLQKTAPSGFKEACAARWKTLQTESAPLRAVLSGQLVSMPETLYDDFIIREIAASDTEFREAVIVGAVLGKYALGIGDSWVALRIEEMIRAGKLEAVTDANEDMPIYHRILKKSYPDEWLSKS